MSVTRKELEKLLTKNDEMSRSKLDYVMQTMPRDLLADYLVSIKRRQELFCIVAASILILYLGLVVSIAVENNWYLGRPLKFSSILTVFYFFGGVMGVKGYRFGSSEAYRLLVSLHDVRALPSVLRSSTASELWREKAILILNLATVEGWPSSMSAASKSRLCRRVVKLLETFSRRKDTIVSDTEADLLIAAARFLVARQPIASQTVLHRIATAPAPEVAHVNSWLVRETAQSLVGNAAASDRPEAALQPVGRI